MRGTSGRRKQISNLGRALSAAALVVVGLGIAAPAPANPGGRYVALGDSYTAGPLIPNQSLDPLGCLRSDANYPHRVAPAVGMSLVDVSCSGAETGDMTAAQ